MSDWSHPLEGQWDALLQSLDAERAETCPVCRGKGVIPDNLPDACWRCDGWGAVSPSVAAVDGRTPTAEGGTTGQASDNPESGR